MSVLTPPPVTNRPSPWLILFAFGGLNGTLAAGYGVLFTIVDDYKREYAIASGQIGIVIGIGFLSGFISQILFAPYADRGHARKVVVIGVLVSVAGLLLMALGTSLWPILIGRIINGLGVGAATPAVRRIVILAGGTGAPFVTTDTAAAQKALELGADILMKATRVDGVYSEDPEKNPHAELYRELTFQQVREQNLRVMDSTAIAHCMEHDLPILVFNYREDGNIERAVRGETIGTSVTSRAPTTT